MLPYVNLSHLDRLMQPVRIAGRDMALLHIYSEPPAYGWADAPGEGIACVDDAARAAVVYLEVFDRQGPPRALEQAQRLLEFVMYMQAPDGQYYNFVADDQGTINRDGPTSRKEEGWWAARGQWALARGLSTFESRDPAFAARLEKAYRRGESALRQSLGEAQPPHELHGVSVPGDLPGGAADLSGLLLLGLCDYQSVHPNAQTQALIERLADGVSHYRPGDGRTSPFGVHPDTTFSLSRWHAWGSHQVQGLARAAQVLHREDWLKEARAEADDFLVPMLATDLVSSMETIPTTDSQIAYGTSMIVSGLASVARASGNSDYARLAGLGASWLTGNNRAGEPLYDPATGRGFDGLDGYAPPHVNRNSGAESTIESLYALLQVDDTVGRPFLEARPTAPIPPPGITVEAEAGQGTVVTGGVPEVDFSGKAAVRLHAGQAVQVPVNIPSTAAYDVFLAHLHDGALKVSIDQHSIGSVPSGSDATWLSLDRLTSDPVPLTAGPHRLRIEAASAEDATADAVLLRPSVLDKTVHLPDGTDWTLHWTAATSRWTLHPTHSR